MKFLIAALLTVSFLGVAKAGEPAGRNKFYVSALELMKKRQHQAAKTLLDLALKEHPDSPIILVTAGECCEKLGKKADAKKLYQKAVNAGGKLKKASPQDKKALATARARLKALAPPTTVRPRPAAGPMGFILDGRPISQWIPRFLRKRGGWDIAAPWTKLKVSVKGAAIRIENPKVNSRPILILRPAGLNDFRLAAEMRGEGKLHFIGHGREKFAYLRSDDKLPSPELWRLEEIEKKGKTLKWKTNGREIKLKKWYSLRMDRPLKLGLILGAGDSVEIRRLGFGDAAAKPGSFSTAKGSSGVPADAEAFGGHSYKFYQAGRGQFSWQEARKRCEKVGGYLASITSSTENQLVTRLARGKRVWLGGTDEGTEGRWRWLSKQAFTYNSWGRGEPSNDGGRGHYLMSWKGTWNDTVLKDGNVAGYVCEWDEVKSASGGGVATGPGAGPKQVSTAYKPPTPPAGVAAAHPVIAGTPVHLTYGEKYDSVLVLQGDSLLILDKDGIRVTRELKLAAKCTKVFERKEYFVALSKDAALFVDKYSGKTRKTVKLPVSQTLDLAIHPAMKVCYIAATPAGVKDRHSLDAKRLFLLDEVRGKAEMLPRVYADRLAMNPTGKYLYASMSMLYKRGYKLDRHVWRVMPDYGHIDILTSLEIHEGWPTAIMFNRSPGANGRRLAVSPDGRSVSFIAGGGYRSGKHKGYNIPAFDAINIGNVQMAWRVGAYPSVVAYHPTLDLVMASTGAPRFFKRSSTERRDDVLTLPRKAYSGWGLQVFSPGGKHYIAVCENKEKQRAARVFKLTLLDKEKAALAVGLKPPTFHSSVARTFKGTDRAAVVVPINALDSLRSGSKGAMSTKDIAKRFTESVVVVKHGGGSGTGFFVGSTGYVLTCAHVLPRFGQPQVLYNFTAGGKTIRMKSAAQVIRVDRKRDLALLKIRTDSRLPVVYLSGNEKVAMGESVSVIGHPGLGPKILEYTMTTGIVSNPRRVSGGQVFIQTNAGVNPGSSGSPLFNSKGNVIGLVVLKARIDAVALALPRSTVVEFLQKACKKK